MNLKTDMITSKSQTLITGVYRTGSEYITQLVNCHPQVRATMYSVNVLRFIYGKYDLISQKENYNKALQDINERIQQRYDIHLDFEILLDTLNRLDEVTYGILYDTVMSSLYLKNPAVHWAEKNQLLWREIPLFLDMMSNGKAILVIRDPRAVLLSFKHYTYAAPPAYLGAVFNCYDAMLTGIELQKTLSPEQIKIVRYEECGERSHQNCTGNMELSQS